jgi:hypothetical protein
MSYENFLGTLSAPIPTRAHLSVVPDLMDAPLTPG